MLEWASDSETYCSPTVSAWPTESIPGVVMENPSNFAALREIIRSFRELANRLPGLPQEDRTYFKERAILPLVDAIRQMPEDQLPPSLREAMKPILDAEWADRFEWRAEHTLQQLERTLDRWETARPRYGPRSWVFTTRSTMAATFFVFVLAVSVVIARLWPDVANGGRFRLDSVLALYLLATVLFLVFMDFVRSVRR